MGLLFALVIGQPTVLSCDDLSDDDLGGWVDRGTGYARSLPAKR